MNLDIKPNPKTRANLDINHNIIIFIKESARYFFSVDSLFKLSCFKSKGINEEANVIISDAKITAAKLETVAFPSTIALGNNNAPR